MAASRTRVHGTVTRKRVSPGSKSDREAVVLETDGGALVLRRRGGNPFRDAVVEGLVGKRISASGLLRGKTLIMDGWDED